MQGVLMTRAAHDQLRQQLDTQADTIRRLNCENLRLARENEKWRSWADRMRQMEKREEASVSRAWVEAGQLFQRTADDLADHYRTQSR